ncbi:unnamed protein product [Caenorhabditis bovis]|uniref:Fibronectin type-III domain-containing protein n=1 Tax=Caenorhabditis bovis TaxID=2654633 RepID=A0A8S1FCX6_9PELO|nr:unnamed protein product [Caenorhabditis bovis]
MRWIFAFLLPTILQSQPFRSVQNPKGRVVPELDIVYVEWKAPDGQQNLIFTVRHKTGDPTEPWKYIRTHVPNVRVPMTTYRNGDKMHIQIKTEQDGNIVDDFGNEIIVDIFGKQNETPQRAIVHAPRQAVASPSAIASSSAAHGGLTPPLNFTANILSPTSVHLKWTPVASIKPDLYYLVNVKQLTTSSGSTLQNQQIKTAANSFTLGKMISGEKYEMTIRSAYSQDVISPTAAIIEITMPRENEYFEIGNLIISSHFKSPNNGVVNLTWEVPPTMNNRISSYNVEYSEMGSGYWQKIQFHGASSSAALYHLKSNTEYLLRIKTLMINNMITESGQFRFRTPKVEANPIKKVDVIYSHDINSVKLQWILEPHIRKDNVAGYDVYLSQNKDLPDSQWRLVRLNSAESSLSLNDLESATVYYVRVNVRNLDGSVIRAPSIYRFKTIDAEDNEDFEGNSLSYRNIAPGEVEIKWTFPKQILDGVIGSTVLYTDRKDLAPEQWEKVEIEDSRNTSLVLRGLREGTRYSVQIIPRLYTGDQDLESREQFELKTDRIRGTEDEVRFMSQSHPASAPKFEQMSHAETEFMRVVSCNPDAIKSNCAWDEMCITRVEDRTKGWCIPNTLRDSILNS